jgi:hypothetical protein
VILLVDQGMPMATIGAGTLLLAFFIWGLIMGFAGIAIAWVVRGIHVADEMYEPRPFSPGAVGVSTADGDSTTVIIPAQRERPARHRYEPDTDELPAGEQAGLR